jgi:hypothetical protein
MPLSAMLLCGWDPTIALHRATNAARTSFLRSPLLRQTVLINSTTQARNETSNASRRKTVSAGDLSFEVVKNRVSWKTTSRHRDTGLSTSDHIPQSSIVHLRAPKPRSLSSRKCCSGVLERLEDALEMCRGDCDSKVSIRSVRAATWA